MMTTREELETGIKIVYINEQTKKEQELLEKILKSLPND